MQWPKENHIPVSSIRRSGELGEIMILLSQIPGKFEILPTADFTGVLLHSSVLIQIWHEQDFMLNGGWKYKLKSHRF